MTDQTKNPAAPEAKNLAPIISWIDDMIEQLDALEDEYWFGEKSHNLGRGAILCSIGSARSSIRMARYHIGDTLNTIKFIHAINANPRYASSMTSAADSFEATRRYIEADTMGKIEKDNEAAQSNG